MPFFSNLSAQELVLARAGAAVFAASVGALTAVSLKKVSHRLTCVLISFAAGALLFVAAFDILPETVEQLGLPTAAVSALSGYALFWLISRFVFHVCPACSATHAEVDFKAVTMPMVAALSVHSFMDGLAIYGGHQSGSALGLLVLFAVAYHKFPEGMVFALVARGSGAGRLKAFLWTFALEAGTTLAGALAGFMGFVAADSHALFFLLGHVGGGFVYLVFHALLSEVVKHHPKSTLLAAAAGAAAMFAVGALLGPVHAH